jgi:hypothetical protein
LSIGNAARKNALEHGMTVQFRVGKSHKVPDHIVVRHLIDDLDEYCDGPWSAVLIKSNGAGILRCAAGAPSVPGDVAEKMIAIADMLNRELHFEGHWVVAWADSEITLLWRDIDGDLQFTNTFAEPWARVRNWPVTEFVQRAQLAWSRWHDFTVHGLDLRADQRRRDIVH